MSLQRNLLPQINTYLEEQGHVLFGRGKERKTDCIFHGGGDSFYANQEKGVFLCRNCGAHGDVVDYQMYAHKQDFVTACKALGAWVDDKNGSTFVRKKPMPFPARDALEILTKEATLVAVAASNVAHGVALTKDDLSRLRKAAGRINVIVEACA